MLSLRKLLAMFFCSWFVCSCAEGIIGGIAVSTVLFSKESYQMFSSNAVYKARKEVNNEMKKLKQEGHSIKIIQDRSVIYAIGSTNSTGVKSRISEILNKAFNGRYINEITVSTEKRTLAADISLKLRIRHNLLFEQYVRSHNYTVYVYNQKAFVIGKAGNDTERKIVIKVLSGIQYIDDVIAYIVTV